MLSLKAELAKLLENIAGISPEALLLVFVAGGLALLAFSIHAWRARKSRLDLLGRLQTARQDQESSLQQLEHSFEIARSQYEERVVSVKEQLEEHRQRQQDSESLLHTAQEQLQKAGNERDVALENNKRIPLVEQQLGEHRQLLEARAEDLADSRTEVSTLQLQLKQEREVAAEKLKLLQQAREQLSSEFELLANRIFEEKGEKLSKRNKETLETTLNPLREQLGGFKKQVEDIYDKETRERLSLLHEVNSLKELNQRMSKDAINLTRALKGDSKTQGNWGEVVLERVLQESGLRKGHEYDAQVNMKSEDGGRRSPDIVVHLPDDKDIIIDSKVSLLDYERYCSSDDADEKEQSLAAHIQSIRTHIKSLSVKAYQELEGVRTLDFVFVFVPIESAFLLAFEQHPEMFQEAYDRNIVVVSPTTLLATLRTVQNIWRYERQNKNAETIAKQAGGLHDQFVLVLEALEDIGRHIERTQQAYDTTLNRFSRGKGNLVRRAEELERLGAKTRRKIPQSTKDHADIDQGADVVPLLDDVD